jgi:hypothetical protein
MRNDVPDHGALVISLDFELYWGISDLRWPPSQYDQNVLGARVVIPLLLKIFQDNEIAATWAAVGMMFAHSDEEARSYYPTRLPNYDNRSLSPYGKPPADRIYCYAPELIQRIASTPRQEVGTHTFSHYYCLESGQNPEDFEADVAAAVRIAKDHGNLPKSVALPRNQVNENYLRILARNGIHTYRGTQHGWLHRPGNRRQQRALIRRAGRLAEAWFRRSGSYSYEWWEINRPDGMSNVRGSRYLRPANSGPRWLQKQHVRNIRWDILDAARAKRVYHLWWHPEDMGGAIDDALADVQCICEELKHCRDKYGMTSVSMGGAAALASGRPQNFGEPGPEPLVEGRPSGLTLKAAQ